MYTVENILKANGIKTQAINTPVGVLIMANNQDGTFTSFNINANLNKVYAYLGF